MATDEIGRVTHYYGKIGVAIIQLSQPLAVGEPIRFKGPHVDFTQEVKSMQVNHQNIKSANPGDLVGIKVDSKVREGDRVFRVDN